MRYARGGRQRGRVICTTPAATLVPNRTSGSPARPSRCNLGPPSRSAGSHTLFGEEPMGGPALGVGGCVCVRNTQRESVMCVLLLLLGWDGMAGWLGG